MTDKQIEEQIIQVLSKTSSLKAVQTIEGLRDVVSEALADQRTQLIQAVEEKKKKKGDFQDEPYCTACRLSETFCQCTGYNRGLDDVIKLIEGKE